MPLLRSQAHQRIQKNPVLAQAYQRKRQIVDILTPIVQQEYANIDQWRQAQKQVQNFVQEWRKLTEATLAQDDYPRRCADYYMPLNQQSGELLDTFYEKSEQRLIRNIRHQQTRRLVRSRLKASSPRRIKCFGKIWWKPGSTSGFTPMPPVMFAARAERFKKEPAIDSTIRAKNQSRDARSALAEARKACQKRLAENLAYAVSIIAQSAGSDERGSAPAPLKPTPKSFKSTSQAGESQPSAQERLNHRFRRAYPTLSEAGDRAVGG